MNQPSPIHDPNLQRLAQDFDALADLMQKLIDRDRGRVRHKTNSVDEMEFTTEWQMEPSAEMAQAL
jgi:hypothetical protein